MTIATEAVASAAAGLTSTVLGHPLDCVKVRLQTTPGQTTLGCASQMLRTEGPLVFARGLGPPLANAVALNTVMFVAFAQAQKSLGMVRYSRGLDLGGAEESLSLTSR